jgi:hypothetical protein
MSLRSTWSRITIPELVTIEPKTLAWTIGEDVKPKTATLTMHYSEPIKVVGVTLADKRFTHELKTIEEGKKYEIIVTPESSSGPALAVMHIETDCKLTRHRAQRLFLLVRSAQQAAAAAAAASGTAKP